MENVQRNHSLLKNRTHIPTPSISQFYGFSTVKVVIFRFSYSLETTKQAFSLSFDGKMLQAIWKTLISFALFSVKLMRKLLYNYNALIYQVFFVCMCKSVCEWKMLGFCICQMVFQNRRDLASYIWYILFHNFCIELKCSI